MGILPVVRLQRLREVRLELGNALCPRGLRREDGGDELGRQETGAGGEIQLTDAMARTIGRVPFHGLRFEGRRFDCGSKAGFLEANVAYALERDDLRAEMREIVRRYADPAEG